MADIFENLLVCASCDQKTERTYITKDSFRLRAWKCKECKKEWIHPADQQDYENFSKIKNKRYQVKLRIVGNSYTVSIPREIIAFEEEMQREMRQMNKIIYMSLEEPEKLSLFFSRRVKSFINEDEEEEEGEE